MFIIVNSTHYLYPVLVCKFFLCKTVYNMKTKRYKKNTKNEESSPSTAVKEWGKVKFNPFARPSPKNEIKLNRKEVVKPDRTEAATPWSKYKNELVQQKAHDEQQHKDANMESDEAKQVLKKREEAYRKYRITENRKEPTVWEDFNEDDDGNEKKDKRLSSISRVNNPFNKKNKVAGKTMNNSGFNKAFLSEEQMQNFDSTKLSFKQNNLMRKIITKNTCLVRGGNLEHAVKDLRRHGVKRKRNN